MRVCVPKKKKTPDRTQPKSIQFTTKNQTPYPTNQISNNSQLVLSRNENELGLRLYSMKDCFPFPFLDSMCLVPSTAMEGGDTASYRGKPDRARMLVYGA